MRFDGRWSAHEGWMAHHVLAEALEPRRARGWRTNAEDVGGLVDITTGWAFGLGMAASLVVTVRGSGRFLLYEYPVDAEHWFDMDQVDELVGVLPALEEEYRGLTDLQRVLVTEVGHTETAQSLLERLQLALWMQDEAIGPRQ